MAYATLDEVLASMGHSSSTDTALSARITAAIPAVSEWIDHDTGRAFDSVSETRTFKVDGYTNELYLPPGDELTAITTLKLDTTDDGTFDTTVTAYELDRYTSHRSSWPYEVVRLLDRCYPYGGDRRYRVEIAGTFGWSAVPSGINMACRLLAARIAQRPSHALFGTESFGDLGAASIRSQDPDYRRLIAPFVAPAVA